MNRRIVYRIKTRLANSRKLRNLSNAFWPLGLSVRVSNGPIEGIVLRVPVFGGVSSYAAGAYEQQETGVLAGLWLSGSYKSFCDVGAHVGYYSLIADRLSDGRCTIHAFEPAERAYVCLAHNLMHNCNGPFSLHACAVGEVSGMVQLAGPSGHVSSRVVTSADEAGSEMNPVRITTLDGALPGETLERPTLIKLDVEGQEAGAIRGSAMLIERLRPTWLAECHSPELELEVLTELRRWQYECFWLNSTDGRSMFPHLLAVPEEDHSIRASVARDVRFAPGALRRASLQ